MIVTKGYESNNTKIIRKYRMKRDRDDNDCERERMCCESRISLDLNPLFHFEIRSERKDISVTENEFDEREECFEGNRSSPLII